MPAVLTAAEPASEMDEVNRWTAAAFGRPLAVAQAARPADTDNLRVLTSSHKVVEPECPANRSNAPYWFLYDGQPSDELLPGWEFSEKPEPAERGSQRVLTYRCPKTGLKVECVVTTYPDSPAVNWVCWLTNEGPAETPVIERFMPLSATLLETRPDQPVTLRWSQGDGCTAESFLPHDEPLPKDQPRSFTGHSSDTTCLPFFNLADADGGWILGIGWTGPWRAEFKHEAQGRVNVTAGMASSHFRLRPGERVRTPRIVLLRYRGPLIAGHNQFRRFMFRYIVPRLDGKPIQPPVACNSTAGLWLKSKRTGQPLGRLTENSELALIVSFRQACVKVFRGAGIVGCRSSSMRRTADEREKDRGPAGRSGEDPAAFGAVAGATSSAHASSGVVVGRGGPVGR